jgi:Na+-transporting methylmalonyl-CoA/oxaloacetate decarboxylase gamma subunit
MSCDLLIAAMRKVGKTVRRFPREEVMSDNLAATLASLAKVADHLDESSSGVGHVVRNLVANLTAKGRRGVRQVGQRVRERL